MKKLALALLATVCYVSFTGSAYAATFTKGDIAYARSNLRAKLSTIYWHSMSSSRIVIPVGSEVKIGGISTQYRRLEIVMIKTNEHYDVDCSSRLWDKFFVKNKKDIGLEGLSSDKKNQIENGMVVVGMTKEEVYASKGCPAYLAWGQKSGNRSLAEIMQSDKWYYMSNQRGKDVMVTFAGGAVVKAGGYEK